MCTESLNARIFKRMKIRPMPCKRSLRQGNKATNKSVGRYTVPFTFRRLVWWLQVKRSIKYAHNGSISSEVFGQLLSGYYPSKTLHLPLWKVKHGAQNNSVYNKAKVKRAL